MNVTIKREREQKDKTYFSYKDPYIVLMIH